MIAKLFKAFAILVVAFFVSLGCISLVSAADRDIEVPLLLLDGTNDVLTFTGVPDNVQIPVCEQTSKNTIICAVIEDGSVRPLILSVEQEI